MKPILVVGGHPDLDDLAGLSQCFILTLLQLFPCGAVIALDYPVGLGTKGRSNLGYVLLGSTVERLLREIPCSALVVRPPAAEGGNPTEAVRG